MSDARAASPTDLDWLAEPARPRGVELLLEAPDLPAWRRFLDRHLLALGLAQFVAGVIFFFAYNWQVMGRFAKLGLLELLLLLLYLAAVRLGVLQIPGQVCLTAAAVLVGPLLGVYGQAYQTGADSYTLFATWAILIVPWVVAARFAPLWIVWLLLWNTTLGFYLDVIFRWDYRMESLAIEAGLNALAWLLAALAGSAWVADVAACLTWGQLTLPAVVAVVEPGAWSLTILGAWAATLAVTALTRRPYYVALACASFMAVSTSWLGEWLAQADAGVLGLTLCLGFWLVIQASVAAAWLRALGRRA